MQEFLGEKLLYTQNTKNISLRIFQYLMHFGNTVFKKHSLPLLIISTGNEGPLTNRSCRFHLRVHNEAHEGVGSGELSPFHENIFLPENANFSIFLMEMFGGDKVITEVLIPK